MPFVPDDFHAPLELTTDRVALEVLSPRHAAVDFRAIRVNADRIRHVFGPNNGWPAADLSFEQNLADLARHQDEFKRRVAFAYAMLRPETGEYLGCVYIKPIKSKLERDFRKSAYQAQVFFWMAQSEAGPCAEQVLALLVRWLKSAWPFAAVAFPGRLQTWDEWEALAHGATEIAP